MKINSSVKPNYIIRILGLPFVVGIMFLGSMIMFCKGTWYYLKFGGEWVGYANKDEKTMIADIYTELVEQRMANKGENKPNKKAIRKSGTRVPKEDKLVKNG